MKLKLAVLFLALTAVPPMPTTASASPKAIAVLDAEKSWLKALTMRDTKTLQKLLSDNYVHIDSSGRVHYREDEFAGLKKVQPVHEMRREQTVDFAGGAAIVHGISTQLHPGKVTRERYTDVYGWSNNRWQAISAQETEIR